MSLLDLLDWETADECLETSASKQSGPRGQMLAEFLQSGVSNSERWLKEAISKIEEVESGLISEWDEELPYHTIVAQPGIVKLRLLYNEPGIGPYSYISDEVVEVFRRWLLAIERAPNSFEDT